MGLLDKPPPLIPFKEGAFPSRLHSERVASPVGIALGACVAICFITGLMSHYQQNIPPWLSIPTSLIWLYRFTQGLHVATGIAAIPLLLLKLWSVYPRLYAWPPIRSIISVAERAFIAVLVATMLFQLATGLMNATQWYPWSFPFIQTHFAIAFVIVGALIIHIAFQLPAINRGLRKPGSVPAGEDPLAGDVAVAVPDQPPTGQPPTRQSPTDQDAKPVGELASPGFSRRGFFITAGVAVGAVTITTVGQAVTPLQDLAWLAPREPTDGPQGLPINRTAAGAQITPAKVGPDYRLTVAGPRELSLQVPDLQAMPQHEVELPIACVEGWSASARWAGIRISDLLDQAGIDAAATIRVLSLETNGNYGISVLPPEFARDPLTLLALRLGGEELSLDHGYPTRLIAPNRPGVLQTKWVTRLEVV